MLDFSFQKITIKSKKQSLQGFTLVELIIYMGIFLGFIGLLSGLFISTLELQQQSTMTARIEEDSQYLFARFNYDVANAIELIEPAENGEVTQTLVLSTPEGEISYFLEENQLMLKSVSDTEDNILSPGIQAHELSFQRIGNEEGKPSVRIFINLLESVANDTNFEQRDLLYTVGMR